MLQVLHNKQRKLTSTPGFTGLLSSRMWNLPKHTVSVTCPLLWRNTMTERTYTEEKALNEAYGFRGLEPMMVQQRHSVSNSGDIITWSASGRQWEKLGIVETSKPAPCDTPPPTRSFPNGSTNWGPSIHVSLWGPFSFKPPYTVYVPIVINSWCFLLCPTNMADYVD